MSPVRGGRTTAISFVAVGWGLACVAPGLKIETAPATSSRAPVARSAPASSKRPAAPRQVPSAGSEPDTMRGIVAAHNRVRAQVGVDPLQWSAQLEAYAREWADQLQRHGCAIEHRPHRGRFAQRYGENLYWGMGRRASPQDVVGSWASEARDYDPRSGACRGVCGHFTQIAWKNTRNVGCAVARCSDAETWVCNYDPPGNFMGEKAF